jgi:hypothetical protein
MKSEAQLASFHVKKFGDKPQEPGSEQEICQFRTWQALGCCSLALVAGPVHTGGPLQNLPGRVNLDGSGVTGIMEKEVTFIQILREEVGGGEKKDRALVEEEGTGARGLGGHGCRE